MGHDMIMKEISGFFGQFLVMIILYLSVKARPVMFFFGVNMLLNLILDAA